MNHQHNRVVTILDAASSSIVKAIAALIALSAISQAADMDGKALFEKRCGGCHSLDTDREGPRLRGVVGRPAASVQTFQYSKALQETKIIWEESTLDKWLTDTDAV